MKRLSLLLFLALPLFAQECCEPCCGFSFGAEWLYLTPSFDQSEFIVDGPPGIPTAAPFSITSERVGEKQKYYSAYRLEASYLFCNQINALTARYSNFSNTYKDKVDVAIGNQMLGLTLSPVLDTTAPGNVTFERDYQYYNIEGLYTLYRSNFCSFMPSFSTGVKFIHLHIKENANYYDGGDNLHQFVTPDMRAWALGPFAAFDAVFCLTKCLDIIGRFQIGMLASESHSKLTVSGNNDIGQNQVPNTLVVKDSPKLWHSIQTTYSRIGLSLDKECFLPLCCYAVNLDIEGGYEFLNERRIINRIYDFNRGLSWDEWSDFTLNGPYLRLNLTY
ncbi:MAG: hypothetical protein H7A36_02655 [Chlamydiales bacterium]|nr:hypothetical protein [Chlamydiales bacterium]